MRRIDPGFFFWKILYFVFRNEAYGSRAEGLCGQHAWQRSSALPLEGLLEKERQSQKRRMSSYQQSYACG